MSKFKNIAGLMLALLMVIPTVLPAKTSAQVITPNLCSTLVQNLTVGSRGAGVVILQTFLEERGYLTIPAGVAKGYFGPLTRAAVSRYQIAKGITPTVGYFGPITRGALISDCATSTPNPNPQPGDDNLKGGSGEIEVTSRSSGTQNEVLEGKEEVKVLGFDVEAQDSDVAIQSVRVEFEHTGTTGSDKLSRYVDEVQIMLGNKVVGSADVNDFSESNDVYSRNIPVSGAIIREGDKERMYVAITSQENIDSRDLGEDWTVGLGQIRFKDATGAILTDNSGDGVDGDITEVFTFEDLASSGDIELTVNEDDESINDAHTVQVDNSGNTNDVELLSFTLKAKGSDINLNEMTFDITSSGAGVTEIADDFRLLMDGEEVGDVTIDGGSFDASSDTTRTITVRNLDDDDVIIESGDEVSFILEADINEVGGAFNNGDTLSVSLNSDNIDAEDENGDEVTDLTGTASSEDISFASTGIDLSSGAADSSSVLTNVDNVSSDDQGKFVINFEVSAFDDPAYIALTGTSVSTSSSAAGVYAYVEDVNNNDVPVGSGATTVVLERVSGGTISGDYLRINAGQTAQLRATVYYDPAVSGTYRAQLGQINFASSAVAGTSSQRAVPTSNYQSPSEQVLN